MTSLVFSNISQMSQIIFTWHPRTSTKYSQRSEFTSKTLPVN